MYYLLENYSSDPEIHGLVNNTAMYFVPMVNPDGYMQNQTTNPNGGGMWRKNKRDNNGVLNDAGVDLNRNYGYEWGGLGTSNDFSSNVYRGPSAFSEPETQAIKFFTETHNFTFALNYHTSGNLLLYPYGYDYNQFTPSNSYFEAFTPIMVRFNNYTNEISSSLYPAAGDADDWMFGGDLENKPSILSMTPEVGNSFWPPASDILGMCRENVDMNLTIARLSGVYGDIDFIGNSTIDNGTDTLPFRLQSFGIGQGTIQVDFEAIGTNVELTGLTSFELINPDTLESMDISLGYSLLLEISDGTPFQVVAHINNGSFSTDKIFDFVYGNLVSLVSTDGESMNLFSSDSWDLTDESFYSPNQSITDSPYGEYSDNNEAWIELTGSVDLENVESAFVSYWAKWDIETDWDYAEVMVSTDGGNNWSPLCGQYTHAGNNNQDLDQPIYDGTQSQWVHEQISLADYLGGELKLAFRLVSDQSIVGDGFYFDDLEVLTFDQTVGVNEQVKKPEFKIYPNPAQNQLHISNLSNSNSELMYEIIDISGKMVKNGKLSNSFNSIISIEELNSGSYFIRLIKPDGIVDFQKFQKLR